MDGVTHEDWQKAYGRVAAAMTFGKSIEGITTAVLGECPPAPQWIVVEGNGQSPTHRRITGPYVKEEDAVRVRESMFERLVSVEILYPPKEVVVGTDDS